MRRKHHLTIFDTAVRRGDGELMQITLTSKRQATFPLEVCEAMRLKPGARLEIVPGAAPDEWVIRPFRICVERLAPLQGRLRRGAGTFDLTAFREAPKDHAALRD